MIIDFRLKAYVALSLATIFWGLSFVATKFALESFSTFTLVFIRFALASCIFLFIILFRGFPKFTEKEHMRIFLMALFEPGLYFAFETIGLQHTSAPKVALIIATIPVVVMVFATFLLKERSNALNLFGMGISIAGILVLISEDLKGSLGIRDSLVGDLYVFGAVISASLYIVSARHLGKKHSALEFTSMQIMYASLLYIPAFIWEFPNMAWSKISMQSLWALGFLAVFATVGGFLCYNYALTKVHATKASVFINGIPVVTAISAWVLLGETLNMIQGLGGIIVLLGVFLANIYDIRERIPASQGFVQ